MPFVIHFLFVFSMILSSSAVIYLVMMFVRIKQCGFNFRNFLKPRTSSVPVISFAPCFTHLNCFKGQVLCLCCPVVVYSFCFLSQHFTNTLIQNKLIFDRERVVRSKRFIAGKLIKQGWVAISLFCTRCLNGYLMYSSLFWKGKAQLTLPT